MGIRSCRFASVLLCGGVVACGGTAEEPWTTQLSADGPCWAVDLSDGLTEGTTEELDLMVDCFDHSGLLAPVRPVFDALDATGPSGDPVGHGVVAYVNQLLAGGLDLAVAVQDIADRLAALDTAIRLGTQVAVELVYARPYRDVSSVVELTDPAALNAGVVVPALPTIGTLALQATTDDGDLVDAMHDLLGHPRVPDLACTVLAVARSEDSDIRASLDGLPAALGEARLASISPDNDRWGLASGDSIRDLLIRLQASEGAAWGRLSTQLAVVLRLDGLGPRVEDAFRDVVDAGHLDQLPQQLRYLATVDVQGDPVAPGGGADGTAWTSLLRLLSNANEPTACSVDLGFTSIDIDLGNVAVAILEFIARQDPELVTAGLDLLAGVLDFPLTDDVLDLIAGTGACPVLDHRFVDDLGAIDRLTDREAEDLLYAAIAILAALEGGESHPSAVPELVDAIDIVYADGLAEPSGELLIDLGGSELVETFIDAIPWMLDPDRLDAATCPPGTQPLTFQMGWDIADDLVSPQDTQAAMARIGPTVGQLLDDSQTWTVVDNAVPLLLATDAKVHIVPSTLADAIADDPSLDALHDTRALLADEEAWFPLVAVAATPEVLDAVASTEAPQGGPLPYLSRLVVDGTLDDLMRTLAMAAELLTGASVDAE